MQPREGLDHAHAELRYSTPARVLHWIIALGVVLMPRWQLRAAAANHRALYVLMFLVPLLGWLTASYFPALRVFGTLSLPAITAPDRALSDRLAIAHGLAALLLIGLIGLHLGAVLFHLLIRRDRVVHRMLPSRPVREDPIP